MVKIKKIRGGVTAPQEFQAAGITVGIKKSKKKDLALIFSAFPAQAAAIFTINKFVAAPILVSQEQIKNPFIQAIIVNSGNANCATGINGMDDAWAMARATAEALDIPREAVLVASTGVIGTPMPIKKILKGINVISQQISRKGSYDAAQAIMTTDKTKKEIAVSVRLEGGEIKIGAMAKGSGMIYPQMDQFSHATLLAFITTDANIESPSLNDMLKDAADVSFNMISVDGCMSTNDCVFMLANGASGVTVKSSKDMEMFKDALNFICIEMAKAIAADGEGATKLLEVRVNRANDNCQARKVAREVSNSMLLKAALFGKDPNLGRILSAVGQAGAEVDCTEVHINDVKIAKNGTIQYKNLGKASRKLSSSEIIIVIDLGIGFSSAVAWGCDLTYDYVKINAKYRT
jgi:glutamate N-acetyltransferase / amino-acid N-acetyltransferase